MKNETITIPVEQFEHLMEDSDKLSALIFAGVEKMPVYKNALEILHVWKCECDGEEGRFYENDEQQTT